MTMTLISRLPTATPPVLFCCAVYDADIGRHRLHHFEGEAGNWRSVTEALQPH